MIREGDYIYVSTVLHRTLLAGDNLPREDVFQTRISGVVKHVVQDPPTKPTTAFIYLDPDAPYHGHDIGRPASGCDCQKPHVVLDLAVVRAEVVLKAPTP